MKDVLPDDPRMARVVIVAAEERVADQLRDLAAQGVDGATAARLAAGRLAAATMFPARGVCLGHRPDRGCAGPCSLALIGSRRSSAG